mmetsp:Transcript_4073/g.7506  ORF Transcript_4073/g.7506 Transcript_4073/m.7506 type:complete len:314 (+) Transcript_4073:68-1009(+)|eukprot:CAMPEP_0197531414 /NCGR_PEP_ID=MMETSP1318-20131121/35537_1 /TAXON_ID=552666 /ORGANISM="Partenskyella glossopodia, Strain RCC365" /LENGTH=313 /DNA_ID=CAMNT_0043087625 /DNA_START=28 /DNA_END=969 /DNA_ORIENTATION=+
MTYTRPTPSTKLLKTGIAFALLTFAAAADLPSTRQAKIPPPRTLRTQHAGAKARKVEGIFDGMGFGQIRKMAARQASEPGHAHMFNGFRLAGDFLHLASFVFLLMQFHHAKNCGGISLKSQELYLLVFLARYMDIFWNFISLYNSIMKLLFIGTTVYIIYMMRVVLRITSTKEPLGLKLSGVIIGTSLILSLLFNDRYPDSTWFGAFVEVSWTFSIYLEALAIIPQMEMLGRAKIVKNLTANYLFALGAYRVFYLLNYAYRFSVDPVSSREFVIKAIAAVVQTLLYAQFFKMYLESKQKGVDADVVMNPKAIV